MIGRMISHVTFLAGLVLLLSGSTGKGQERECNEPWLTSAQLAALSETERSGEFRRLLDCARQGISEAQTMLGRLSAIRIDEFANTLVAERDRLNDLLASRSEALANANNEIALLVRRRDELARQVEELTRALEDARAQNRSAQEEIANLTGQIAALVSERDRLTVIIADRTKEVEAAKAESDAAKAEIERLKLEIAGLRSERDALTIQVAGLTEQLSAAEQANSQARSEIARLEAEVDRLKKHTAALADEHRRLNGEVEKLTAELDAAGKDIVRLRGEVESLGGALISANAEIARLGSEIGDLEKERDTLRDANAQLREAIEAARSEIANLEAERDDLRNETARMGEALEKARSEIEGLASRVASLDAELADANARIAELEGEVDVLAKQRSQFFARLMEILGDRKDIRIVGDRFVFQSEVLFAVGSASLNQAGRDQIVAVAKAIIEIEKEIPASIRWVLQVNGHTDKQRVLPGGRFASNWELSAARALTVVHLLQAEGVPPRHLAAAGFGEYQPLDSADTQEAYRINRRIELKLTDDGG